MAATVTANLTDITLGEAADSGNWTGTDGNSTEIFRQGSGSEGWVVSKNANETGTFDAYTNNSNATFDLSGTDVHLYITMRCDIAPFIDYVHFGLQSALADGAAADGTNYWTVVDNTTNIEWAGEWITIKLDVNSTSTFSSAGSLDLANISDVHINVDNSNSGNIRSIENTYIDAIRFGTGLKITGTVWDWQDVADDDNLNANKYDIVRAVGPGVFEVNGQLQIGDGATVTTPSSSNETLFFKDISTSGIEGGPIGKQATGFYKISVVGSGVDATFSNMSVIGSANADFLFDADDVALSDASIDWNGGTVIECRSFLSDGAQDFTNMGFYDCGQIVPAGSDFTGFLIDNYTGTDGAILWPGGTTVNGGTIQNSDRAIEITQTSNQTFTNILFPSNTYDVHLNNGGVSIDVSKTGTSNPTNYIATGGGVVTFVGASVTVAANAVTTVGGDVENVRVFLKAADDTGPFPYNETITITNTATHALASHTGHGLSTGDYVDIKGANLWHNNGAFRITASGANHYYYSMPASPGSNPTGSIGCTFVALTGLTNASGDLSTTRVYASPQPVTGWGRLTPQYKTAPLFGTVDDTGGLSVTAVMIDDT
jgi:hypothetical protein